MKKTIITAAIGLAAALSVAACSEPPPDPEPLKPVVEMVKLPDGTEVPCILLPDETETVYEEMSCDYPEDQPTK